MGVIFGGSKVDPQGQRKAELGRVTYDLNMGPQCLRVDKIESQWDAHGCDYTCMFLGALKQLYY